MKNKKKKLVFFLVLFLSIGFFGFRAKIFASADELVVTEIMYDPMENEDKKKVEWVEMYANADKKFNLKTNGQIENFYLCAKKGDVESSCKSAYVAYATTESLEIKKGDFIIFTKDPEIFRNTYDDYGGAIIIRTSSSFNLLENDDAYIAYSQDNKSTWHENVSYGEYFDEKEIGHSLEKIDFKTGNTKNNWQESFDYGGTPGKKSSTKPEPKVYSNKIIINEILPNPAGKNEEYIEIFDGSGTGADLAGWVLRDGTKTKKYALTEKDVFDEDGFLVVYKSKSGLSLNDSTAETVKLLSPDEKVISEISYKSAKDGISYNWNGSKWRWSRHLTPGAENIFDDEPDFKVDIDDDVYKNFPASFKVRVKNYKKDKTKITWNFGDGHKSYKKETMHKYKEKGKYSGSVKIFNGSEEVVKTFEVEVKKYPEHDVNIISLVPNPEGKDSDFETITLKNNSKKKINLKGWSIATGDKKLVNHPISTKITLKPKGTAEITRSDSKFTLNNKKGRVELRYPNGKVASKVKYDRKTTSAKEGEILEKTKLGWVWKNTSSASGVPQETSLLAAVPETGENLEKSVVLGVATDLIGGYSERTPRKDFRLILARLVYVPSFVQTEEHNQSRIKPEIDLSSLFF